MTRRSLVWTKWAASALAGTLVLGSANAWAAPPAKAPAKKPAAAADKKPAGKDAAAAGDAKGDLAAAKKHYGDGETKYKAGDYAGALAEFQAADAIKPTPHAARYIGLCQDSLGHFQEAVAAYERFLANVPPKLAAQGDEIKARVAAIKALPGRVHVDSDPKGASVLLDGKPLPAPTPTDVDAAPGRHTLRLTLKGYEASEKNVDVTFASKQDVRVTLPASLAPTPPIVAAVPATPEPATAPPSSAPAETSQPLTYSPNHTAEWITGGLAVAAAGVGTVFGIMALGDKSDFNSHPTSAKADDEESHALIADVSFGVAAALAVTTVVLLVTSNGSASGPATGQNEPKPFSVSAAPILTPHGGGAGALVRF